MQAGAVEMIVLAPEIRPSLEEDPVIVGEGGRMMYGSTIGPHVGVGEGGRMLSPEAILCAAERG